MITTVTTVTTMFLDVNKGWFYRLYRKAAVTLVPLVTEGGIKLTSQANSLISKISTSAWWIANEDGRCRSGNEITSTALRNENQSSTSTRWSRDAKSAANTVSLPTGVQRATNMHRPIAREGDYKYARNVVRLSVEGCASAREPGETAERAEMHGFGPKKTRVRHAGPGKRKRLVISDVISKWRGAVPEKVGYRR